MSAKLMVVGGESGYAVCMLYKPGTGDERDTIEGYSVFYEGKPVSDTNIYNIASAYEVIKDILKNLAADKLPEMK